MVHVYIRFLSSIKVDGGAQGFLFSFLLITRYSLLVEKLLVFRADFLRSWIFIWIITQFSHRQN